MRWLLAPILVLGLLIGTGAAARSIDPAIWYNPHVPLDFPSTMFTPDAPWQHAAGKVDVIEIVHWWIGPGKHRVFMHIGFECIEILSAQSPKHLRENCAQLLVPEPRRWFRRHRRRFPRRKKNRSCKG